LGLDGYVQGGSGLVEDDELGSGDQSPGNADALPLTAAEFVRVAVDMVLTEAHFSEHVPDPLHHLGAFSQAVHLQGIPHCLFDEHTGVQ